ncbi:uncharacterized protein LOC111903155 [Lactuca sativa]|uniref:Uncharacterized protein n=1 Tax=Lactuca sativa TaxID=4236 RepID=A0A9R1WLW7_LACSA|nr:uncharacterized protein LOC111903155 [Lactuca sativa]KAJ0184975.1 hypothetical protein LSAT_V11C900500180 [Lactuca sativa]
MDPQLLIPSSAPIDFNFDSTSTSPYATAPSSPKILLSSFFYSAPTSPVGVSPMDPEAADDFQSTEPFESCDENHEQKNSDYYEEGYDTDFAFDFSGQLERPLISAADELFYGGKIKPLDPQPLLQSSKDLTLPRSPKLYPVNYKKKYSEPFSNALNQSPRGRERTITTTRNKTSQSLSPMRVSDILLDHQKVSSTNQSSPFGFMWYNKWNLKNLLLFRSTSEGSAATSDDPLKKYAMITKGEQDTRNSSFRSSDGGGSVGGSSRRRSMKRKVSAHEIHYTANRAMAEEMKNKTFLPYKSGLLGCLGFSHNLREVSRGR